MKDANSAWRRSASAWSMIPASRRSVDWRSAATSSTSAKAQALARRRLFDLLHLPGGECDDADEEDEGDDQRRPTHTGSHLTSPFAVS